MQALGLPQETVVYGLQEDEEEEEGVFEIGSSSGEITVGPNGTDNLVIKVGCTCTILCVSTLLMQALVRHLYHLCIYPEWGCTDHHFPSICLLRISWPKWK